MPIGGISRLGDSMPFNLSFSIPAFFSRQLRHGADTLRFSREINYIIKLFCTENKLLLFFHKIWLKNGSVSGFLKYIGWPNPDSKPLLKFNEHRKEYWNLLRGLTFYEVGSGPMVNSTRIRNPKLIMNLLLWTQWAAVSTCLSLENKSQFIDWQIVYNRVIFCSLIGRFEIWHRSVIGRGVCSIT